MRIEELRDLAGGDAEAAGWLAAQSLAGRPISEAVVNMQTARTNLENLQKGFASGNKLAPLLAVRLCAWMYNFPLPAWASEEIARAVSKRNAGEAQTLDEAFGAPKLTYRKVTRKAVHWEGYVFLRVKELREQGKRLRGTTDKDMYQAVADEINKIAPRDLRVNRNSVEAMYLRRNAFMRLNPKS